MPVRISFAEIHIRYIGSQKNNYKNNLFEREQIEKKLC